MKRIRRCKTALRSKDRVQLDGRAAACARRGAAGERAYVFLSDRGREEASLTFSELERRAYALAAQLVGRGQRGERALLMFPPGLDFIVAFFGCLIARMIAVPMMPPRRLGARDSSASIVADCTPRFALTSPNLPAARSDLAERLKATALDFIYVDATKEAEAPAGSIFAKPGLQDLAFLQYTSGSTWDPKDGMVSHEPSRQCRDDPARVRQHAGDHICELGPALSRYGAYSECAADALCRLPLLAHGADIERLQHIQNKPHIVIERDPAHICGRPRVAVHEPDHLGIGEKVAVAHHHTLGIRRRARGVLQRSQNLQVGLGKCLRRRGLFRGVDAKKSTRSP